MIIKEAPLYVRIRRDGKAEINFLLMGPELIEKSISKDGNFRALITDLVMEYLYKRFGEHLKNLNWSYEVDFYYLQFTGAGDVELAGRLKLIIADMYRHYPKPQPPTKSKKTSKKRNFPKK